MKLLSPISFFCLFCFYFYSYAGKRQVSQSAPQSLYAAMFSYPQASALLSDSVSSPCSLLPVYFPPTPQTCRPQPVHQMPSDFPSFPNLDTCSHFLSVLQLPGLSAHSSPATHSLISHSLLIPVHFHCSIASVSVFCSSVVPESCCLPVLDFVCLLHFLLLPAPCQMTLPVWTAFSGFDPYPPHHPVSLCTSILCIKSLNCIKLCFRCLHLRPSPVSLLPLLHQL